MVGILPLNLYSSELFFWKKGIRSIQKHESIITIGMRDDINKSMTEGINTSLVTIHKITSPGTHIFKYWMVDSGIVLQKIVVDMGGLKPSYLGPPESFIAK